METHRDVMINFPLPILAKSFTKSGSINLRPMLLEAMRTHIGQYCIKKRIRPDSTVLILPGIDEETTSTILLAAHFKYSWEEAHNWKIGEDMIEFVIEEASAAIRRYTRTSTPPYCSISLSVWLDYMDNEEYKDDFEKVSLLCAMAIRSIVGPHTAKPITWDYILSRMAGNSRKTEILTLPDVIQSYDQARHRKKKERLLREMQEHWGIQYKFMGRKPWYCTDPKVNLSEWILTQQREKDLKPNKSKTLLTNATEYYPLGSVPMYIEVEKYFYSLLSNPNKSEFELDMEVSELTSNFMYGFMKNQEWEEWQKTAIFWLKSIGTPI